MLFDWIEIQPIDLYSIAQLEQLASWAPWSMDGFSEELKKPHSFLYGYQQNKQWISYIVFWILQKECELLNIVVHPGYRCLGYAQKMLQQMLLMARQNNCQMAYAQVRISNFVARKLYQKMGFYEQCIRKNLYTQSQDQLLFEDGMQLCQILN